MQDTHDQNLLADDPIDHDVHAERMNSHGRREFVALSRGARIGGKKFEYSFEAGVVLFRCASPNSAAPRTKIAATSSAAALVSR
jgi:hypothetical protein